MSQGSELWQGFKKAFLEEVRAMSGQDLNTFWSSCTRRTQMYRDQVLPKVGERLGLELSQEYMRIDGHYRDRQGFPQIFLEWENIAKTAIDEMEKLCSVRAPLKVLITVDAWPNEELKQDWVKCIRDSSRWLPEPESVYGFVVGEAKLMPSKDEALFFHFFFATSEGEATPEEEELIGAYPSAS